jgi:hypothetical protein
MRQEHQTAPRARSREEGITFARPRAAHGIRHPKLSQSKYRAAVAGGGTFGEKIADFRWYLPCPGTVDLCKRCNEPLTSRQFYRQFRNEEASIDRVGSAGLGAAGVRA